MVLLIRQKMLWSDFQAALSGRGVFLNQLWVTVIVNVRIKNQGFTAEREMASAPTVLSLSFSLFFWGYF